MSFFDTASADWKPAWNDNGRQVVTLQRKSVVKVGGVAADTWANVAGQVSVPCDLQPAGSSIRKRFAELGLVVQYTVYLSRDIGARASDRLTMGSRNFMVVEGGYQTGDMAGWPALANVQEVPSSP